MLSSQNVTVRSENWDILYLLDKGKRVPEIVLKICGRKQTQKAHQQENQLFLCCLIQIRTSGTDRSMKTGDVFRLLPEVRSPAGLGFRYACCRGAMIVKMNFSDNDLHKFWLIFRLWKTIFLFLDVWVLWNFAYIQFDSNSVSQQLLPRNLRLNGYGSGL